eukprot:509090-Prorocentrum_minimum.AAC.1
MGLRTPPPGLPARCSRATNCEAGREEEVPAKDECSAHTSTNVVLSWMLYSPGPGVFGPEVSGSLRPAKAGLRRSDAPVGVDEEYSAGVPTRLVGMRNILLVFRHAVAGQRRGMSDIRLDARNVNSTGSGVFGPELSGTTYCAHRPTSAQRRVKSDYTKDHTFLQ